MLSRFISRLGKAICCRSHSSAWRKFRPNWWS